MEKPKKEYVMIGISPDVHTKLKVQCANERRSIKTVVEKLILDYLATMAKNGRMEGGKP